MSKKIYTPYMEYQSRLRIHGLISREGRREESDVIFLSILLILICYSRVPRINTRFAILFRITQQRTNDRDERGLLTRIQKTCNSDYSHIDMFILLLIQVVTWTRA